MNVRDIAKLIRKDLRAAMPAIKWSVRIERYSMGQSINVEGHTDVPLYVTGHELNANGKVLQDKAEAIVNAYNFDDSDSMNDYFNVNFYGGVRLVENK